MDPNQQSLESILAALGNEQYSLFLEKDRLTSV